MSTQAKKCLKHTPENGTLMTCSFSRHIPIKERYQKLMEAVSPEDRLAIIIDPDPDAIASAMALRRLFWRRIKSTSIYHIKPINRVDNLTLIRVLNVAMLPINELDQAEITKYAIVDSQPGHNKLFQGHPYHIIVDHHPLDGEIKAPFVDIRPDYGATSTLFTEYLRAARITPSSRLASALFYGIKTDTNNFVREANEHDMKAFRYLFRFANMNVVKKIESSEITKKSLEYYKRAMEKLRFWKGIAYSHMGSLGNPDVCVQVADFFLKLSEASWSIVSGVYGGTLVVIFRNDGFRKDAGKWAQRLFGDYGKAGGHKAAARAEVPLKNLKPLLRKGEEVESLVFRLVKRISSRS